MLDRKALSIGVKKNLIVLRDIEMFQRKIYRQLKISRHCIRQTICKLDRYGTVGTTPGAGLPKKTTIRQTWLIKLEKICDKTNSLADLARYANTNMNLSVSTSMISCILRQYNMVSSRAPRKARITPKQRRGQIAWCNEHLFKIGQR